MTSIGIVGAGIAGLHLGLLLQKKGISATIYTEKGPEQQRAARLSNIVIRHAPTRERERWLGVNHWDSAETDLVTFGVQVGGGRPLAFVGDLGEPVQVVDMRLYWARLLEDFCERGGRLVLGMLQLNQLDQLAAEHDLVVVAAGRGGLGNLFPRIPERSPYAKPQRVVVGGLYRGIAYPQPLGFDVAVAPGHGEIIILPTVSSEPQLTGLGIEIIPGGAFEQLKQFNYEDDPQRFNLAVLGLLRDHAPSIYARVDLGGFGLAGPLDLCHVAITPAVRQGYARLATGTFAIALGDTHIVNDPLTGQGANNASHAAWVLGEAIDSCGSFDEAFCRRVEQQIWSYVGPVTEACNARLGPPKPHAIELLAAASRNKEIANKYAQGFNYPDRFWEIVSSPERTAAFLEGFGWEAQTKQAAVGAQTQRSIASAQS